MITLKQSVNGLIHDTNGSLGLIRNYLFAIKSGKNLDEGSLRGYLQKIEEATGRVLNSIDEVYVELKNSKLWEEHL